MKKIMLAMSLIVLSVLVPHGADAKTENLKVIEDMDDYIAYLKEQETDNTSDFETSNAIESLQDLTSEEQEKFIDYLNDPTTFVSFLALGDDLEVGESVSLHDGDVVVSKKSEVSYEDISAYNVPENAITALRATITHSMDIFGFSITKFSSYVVYRQSGKRITSTVSNGAYHTNYNPAVGITKDVRGHYISGGKAVSTTIWTGAFAKWSPITMDKEQKVTADGNRRVSGHLINL